MKNIPKKIIGLLAVLALVLTVIYVVAPFFEKNGEQVKNELQPAEKITSVESKELPVKNKKFSFVVLADSNGGGNAVAQPTVFKSIVAEISTAADKPDFIIHAGDMIAGTSGTSSAWAMRMWEEFVNTINPWAKAEIGFFPSAGNHDASFGWVLPRAYQEFWNKYQNVRDYQIDGSYANSYAFAYQGAYFIVLDGSKINLEQSQLVWLEEKINAAHDQYDNIFVFSHLPLTAASSYHPTDQLAPHTTLNNILRGRITAFFAGHHNVYYDQIINGIRQIGVGRAGSGGAYSLKPEFGGGYQNYYSYLQVAVAGEEVIVKQVIVE